MQPQIVPASGSCCHLAAPITSYRSINPDMNRAERRAHPVYKAAMKKLRRAAQPKRRAYSKFAPFLDFTVKCPTSTPS